MHTTQPPHEPSAFMAQPADGSSLGPMSFLDDPNAGRVLNNPEPHLHTALWAEFANIARQHRRIGMAIAIGGLVVLLLFFTSGLPSTLAAQLQNGTPSLALGVAILIVYVLLLATPFVPSAEIGLAVMLVLGSSVALPVYAATIIGLTIAFAVGRFAVQSRDCEPKEPAQMTKDVVAILYDKFRGRPVLQRLLRFRGLALIVIINMPGNTVFGGGGGIAMAVGYSRTLTYPAFLACVAIAVAPVPALFLFAGAIGLENWLHDWLSDLHP